MLRIFECLHAENQTISDAQVLPLYITNDFPERRELQGYVEIYQKKLYLNSDKCGLFSSKFSLKTHLTINDFLQFSEQHSDADVCLINPFPQLRYWSYNVWHQGEYAHPSLLEKSQMLLDAAGIDINLYDIPRHGSDLLAYSNFWIASPDFWEAYVGGVLLPISEFLDQNPLNPAVAAILHDTNHTNAAPFLPFMIERLFSSFLSINREWKIASYHASPEAILSKYCLNDFERLLVKQMREKVDIADHSGFFSETLKHRMNDMCALFQQHFYDYYAHRPHPHTGHIVTKLAT